MNAKPNIDMLESRLHLFITLLQVAVVAGTVVTVLPWLLPAGAPDEAPWIRAIALLVIVGVAALFVLVLSWLQDWLRLVRVPAGQVRDVPRLLALRRVLGRWLGAMQWVVLLLYAVTLLTAGQELPVTLVLLVGIPAALAHFMALRSLRVWVGAVSGRLNGEPSRPLVPLTASLGRWFMAVAVVYVVLLGFRNQSAAEDLSVGLMVLQNVGTFLNGIQHLLLALLLGLLWNPLAMHVARELDTASPDVTAPAPA